MRRRDFITLVGGTAAYWPLAAHAQKSTQIRHLAVLMSTEESDPQEASSTKSLEDALTKLGWMAGENLEVRYWWGGGDRDRMIANAHEAAGGFQPDVLLVKGANLPAAQQATSTIPIVFVVLSDAVAERYVGSFARPNANITGFTSDERALVGKRLTLLRDVAPRTKRILYVRSRQVGADTDSLFNSLVADARRLNISVINGGSVNDMEIERNFEKFAGQPDGGVIAAFDAFITVHRKKLVELATRYRLPAIYPLPSFVHSGGLLSYGFDQDDQFRQAAAYVARILAGDKAEDLPVQTPTKFKMVVNLKTANAFGLALSPTLIAAVDEVIE